MAQTYQPEPYVGLRPFGEPDSALFFGRERETRVITSNLLTSRLTILYGSSGVGKSSVLQAGVSQHLKCHPSTRSLYFRDWQGNVDSRKLLEDFLGGDKGLISGRKPERMCLMLDQFEEHLLHRSGPSVLEFEDWFARVINNVELNLGVLIGIREDALSRLDQTLGLRIAYLFANTLNIEHLTKAAATEAIVRPLDIYSKLQPEREPFTAEPELVNAILTDIDRSGSVEAPFLQLLLRRIWEEERRQNSTVMRLSTLSKIGGAHEIITRHVNEVIFKLKADEDRAMFSRLVPHLVTPSRTKIAQLTEDLIAFAGGDSDRVCAVLAELTNRTDTRILRRLSSPERFELFHDVLAQPVLDWHASQQREVETKIASDRARELVEREHLQQRARSARRLRALSVVLSVSCVCLVVFIVLTFSLERQARQAERLAEAGRRRAEVLANTAALAANEARARQLDAERARAQAVSARQVNVDALALVQAGDISAALRILRRAVSQRPKHDDAEVQALVSIGELSSKLGEADQAEQSFLSAVTASRRAKDELSEARSSTRLAAMYAKRGASAKAIDLYLRAIELFKGGKRGRDLAISQANLALVYSQSSRHAEALQTITNSVSAVRRLSDSSLMAEALDVQGTIQAAAGDAAGSLDSFKEGLEIAASAGDKKMMLRIVLSISESKGLGEERALELLKAVRRDEPKR